MASRHDSEVNDAIAFTALPNDNLAFLLPDIDQRHVLQAADFSEIADVRLDDERRLRQAVLPRAK
jgi:hypothetical protein